MKRKRYVPLDLPYEYDPDAEPVLGFSGIYRFLSNFFPQTVALYGLPFATSEHAFMYHKSEDRAYRKKILAAPTPQAAKKLGRQVKLRPNWDESLCFESMHKVLCAKFRNKEMKRLLLDTGCAYLEETNRWGDTKWGRCNGVGANHLGRQLMVVRYGIQNE